MNRTLLTAYTRTDFDPLVTFLQSELPRHRITPELFARKTLLDPNFNSDLSIIARSQQNQIIGFIYGVTDIDSRAVVAETPTVKKSWIPLFAVHRADRRRGVGSALFNSIEAGLAARDCREIWISNYTPHYWTPGVDVDAYADAIPFLQHRRYTVVSRPLSMSVSLGSDWRVPAWANDKIESLAGKSVELVTFSPDWTDSLLRFLAGEFPGDWERHLTETMNAIFANYRDRSDVMLAIRDGQILGFAQRDAERFGPFGIARAHRGEGIGAALLYRMLLEMQRRGAGRAWFMWTGDEPARRVYAPAGFQETNRYAIMVNRLV